MGLSSSGDLLREVALLLLLALGGYGSSSPHSLRYFYTAVSEPGWGLPQFITVGYVDDQPITHYDSITRRKVPIAPWMRKVEVDDPSYWDTQSQLLQNNEELFIRDLGILRDRFHQKNSTGLHSWQLMYGCEVQPERWLSEGYWQYAYDGEDFLALDKETLTWTASVPQAFISKKKLDAKLAKSQFNKNYLEKTCVEWLQKYLNYSKETLQRTEAPVTRVTRKKGHDGQETLFCQIYGFYPKEIEVTWMKDGEDWKPETYSGGVVPNSDGTYHTWLSIKVDPKERDRYRCWVGHDSLLEPLELAWEDPATNMGLILGIVGSLTAVFLVVAGVSFYTQKRKEKGCKAASDGLREEIGASSNSHGLFLPLVSA